MRKNQMATCRVLQPTKRKHLYFFNHISKVIDKGLSSGENFLIMGDFNRPVSEEVMKEFCEIYE